jgi:hypothetical protein
LLEYIALAEKESNRIYAIFRKIVIKKNADFRSFTCGMWDTMVYQRDGHVLVASPFATLVMLGLMYIRVPIQ